MLKCICFLSTLFITGCLSIKENEQHIKYLGYKNLELKGIVNTDDYRLTPQKPPGLDNTAVIWFW